MKELDILYIRMQASPDFKHLHIYGHKNLGSGTAPLVSYYFSKIKSQKESQNSGIEDFSYYFCMMIEGSGSGSRAGSGSIPLTSGSGSGRPKNTWIRWIRNTASYRTLFVAVEVMDVEDQLLARAERRTSVLTSTNFHPTISMQINDSKNFFS